MASKKEWEYIETSSPVKHGEIMVYMRLAYHKTRGAYLLMRSTKEKEWKFAPNHRYPLAVGHSLKMLIALFKKSAKKLSPKISFKTGAEEEIYAKFVA